MASTRGISCPSVLVLLVVFFAPFLSLDGFTSAVPHPPDASPSPSLSSSYEPAKPDYNEPTKPDYGKSEKPTKPSRPNPCPTLRVTGGRASPDGYDREVILVNEQTPGPLIEAWEGEEFCITVINDYEKEFSMHWHGILQNGTLHMDGVSGVTQFNIPPYGGKFDYCFTPWESGQYWYHSHFRVQLEDGLRGPFLVHPRPDKPRPFSLIPGTTEDDYKKMYEAEANPRLLQLSDWNRITQHELQDIYYQTGVEPLCFDSLLINGRGNQHCPTVEYLNSTSVKAAFPVPLTDKGCIDQSTGGFGGPDPRVFFNQTPTAEFYGCTNSSTSLPVIEVDQKDGWASINVIHQGGTLEMKLSIDGHKFWVYAADGQYIQPIELDVLNVNIAQRYQAMIKLDNPGDWTIRIASDEIIAVISGFGVLHYVDGDHTPDTKCLNKACDGLPSHCGEKEFYSLPSHNAAMDYAGLFTSTDIITLNEYSDLHPFPPNRPPQVASHTLTLTLSPPNALDPRIWDFDGTPYLAWRDQGFPTIFDPRSQIEARVAIPIPVGEVVDIVIVVPAPHPSHPFHKHDDKSWVIGQGTGNWTWNSVEEAIKDIPGSFNLDNPSYRDTFTSLGGPSWLVVRYQSYQAGPVMLHCHIVSHFEAGKRIVLAQGYPDEWAYVPEQYSVAPAGLEILLTNPNPVYPDGYVTEF